MRASLEVADIFRRYGDRYRLEAPSLSLAQRRVMTAIEQCRTAALGGHVERCDHCHYTRVWYNSCRNRHCPKCQSVARAQWVDRREADLLDCEYFHVVFTVPEAVATIASLNKAVVYGILFRAAAETLQTIAADPKHLGAELGFFAVLHTWGQQLQHHPHVHCVVTGGFFLTARAVAALPSSLLDVPARRLRCRHASVGRRARLARRPAGCPSSGTTRATEWVVYAKRPFAGPRHVLDYVGRYTHRVAISNNRLVDMTDDQIRFR